MRRDKYRQYWGPWGVYSDGAVGCPAEHGGPCTIMPKGVEHPCHPHYVLLNLTGLTRTPIMTTYQQQGPTRTRIQHIASKIRLTFPIYSLVPAAQLRIRMVILVGRQAASAYPAIRHSLKHQASTVTRMVGPCSRKLELRLLIISGIILSFYLTRRVGLFFW